MPRTRGRCDRRLHRRHWKSDRVSDMAMVRRYLLNANGSAGEDLVAITRPIGPLESGRHLLAHVAGTGRRSIGYSTRRTFGSIGSS
jgi:hypothetical protein